MIPPVIIPPVIIPPTDTIFPTVTVSQASGQADPTNASPINFTVGFSKRVTGFGTGDVTVSGTAGATTAIVTSSGATYNVAVSGMTSDGTVIVTIAAGVATDAAGNGNLSSASVDNTVTFDATAPTVAINQAGGQADPTNASPVNFTVVFSEPVTGFGSGDVTVSGTAEATTAIVAGSGTTYGVAVSGMTSNGTVIVAVAAGVATDAVGNPNVASTSVDNTVTFDVTVSTVTIERAGDQADPTNASSIEFTVLFGEPVTGFGSEDVIVGGSAGATTATVTGGGAAYTVVASGMTSDGTVTAAIGAGATLDASGNANAASISADNTVFYDATPPTMTVEQAAGQVDPTNASSTNFTVVFSEAVTGFGTGDVTVDGTAGATTAIVTGGPTTYNVAVSGMTSDGTVTITIAAGVAVDAAGNPNAASTSVDNTVTLDATVPTVTIEQAEQQADPTNVSPTDFTVVFSEPVSGFDSEDVTIAGTAGATTATVTGTGPTYNVAVSGMTSDGTVIVTIAAGVATDAARNPNEASTSVDNVVTFDATAPTVSVEQAEGQADPTNTTPINFTIIFSEPVVGFGPQDVTLSGTAFGTGDTTFVGAAAPPNATVTGDGTIYNVTVTGMTNDGTVIVNIAAGAVADAAGNANVASSSVDNTVTFDSIAPRVKIDQADG